jgi:L-iditol 2-dehydrogenase
MKNRVAKLTQIRKIEIFEEEISKLKKGQILVAMKSVGICGSDMHYFKEGGLGSFKNPLPMYMGHEPAGIIVDSNGSEKFKEGDRVAVEPGMPCVTSYWSMKGKHNLCAKGTFMGANAQGAFSDYVIVEELQLVKIPDNMSYNLASLLEPLGVCLHTANLIEPKFTESATIFGAGPIGLCMYSILEKAGVKDIFMVDKLPYRVKFAKEFGVSESFLLSDNYDKKIKELTNGMGTTMAIDTGGTVESIDGCINVSSVNGKVALIGIPEADFVNYNPHRMRSKELTIKNVRRSNQTLDDCVKHYTGDKNIEKIISHEFKFEDIQKAFDLVADYGDQVLKCIITNN